MINRSVNNDGKVLVHAAIHRVIKKVFCVTLFENSTLHVKFIARTRISYLKNKVSITMKLISVELWFLHATYWLTMVNICFKFFVSSPSPCLNYLSAIFYKISGVLMYKSAKIYSLIRMFCIFIEFKIQCNWKKKQNWISRIQIFQFCLRIKLFINFKAFLYKTIKK